MNHNAQRRMHRNVILRFKAALRKNDNVDIFMLTRAASVAASASFRCVIEAASCYAPD